MTRMLSPVACKQSPDAGTRDRKPLVGFVGGLDNPTSSGRNPHVAAEQVELPEVVCRLHGGLVLRVEGSVVEGSVVVGWNHCDAGMQPSVVVPVDPGRGGEPDVGDGLVGPGMEDRGAMHSVLW